jgi:hypothetical protein
MGEPQLLDNAMATLWCSRSPWPTSGTSRSATPSTTAPARHWPGWRGGWHSALLRCGDLQLDKSVERQWRISVNIRGLRALPITLQPVTA